MHQASKKKEETANQTKKGIFFDPIHSVEQIFFSLDSVFKYHQLFKAKTKIWSLENFVYLHVVRVTVSQKAHTVLFWAEQRLTKKVSENVSIKQKFDQSDNSSTLHHHHHLKSRYIAGARQLIRHRQVFLKSLRTKKRI